MNKAVIKIFRTSYRSNQMQKVKSVRLLSSSTEFSDSEVKHFKVGGREHPLMPKLGDHIGLQQNHIWTKEELDLKLSKLYHYTPKNWTDHFAHKLMFGLYHTFNFITGYRKVNPSVNSIIWRLIVLESVAGVPGFVAAGFRHFHSLRTLSRDYGWIPTLLEEAENERMHLLVCLNAFEASVGTRLLVVLAQGVMTPLLMSMYLVNPKSLHRFVGYLEETACITYSAVIKDLQTPGTHLHNAWNAKPAPSMAIGYWKMPEDAKWIDALKCMYADETHHRDVNHTFADMKSDDPNPYISKHKQDAAIAWRLDMAGESAWGPEDEAAKNKSTKS